MSISVRRSRDDRPSSGCEGRVARKDPLGLPGAGCVRAAVSSLSAALKAPNRFHFSLDRESARTRTRTHYQATWPSSNLGALRCRAAQRVASLLSGPPNELRAEPIRAAASDLARSRSPLGRATCWPGAAFMVHPGQPTGQTFLTARARRAWPPGRARPPTSEPAKPMIMPAERMQMLPSERAAGRAKNRRLGTRKSRPTKGA